MTAIAIPFTTRGRQRAQLARRLAALRIAAPPPPPHAARPKMLPAWAERRLTAAGIEPAERLFINAAALVAAPPLIALIAGWPLLAPIMAMGAAMALAAWVGWRGRRNLSAFVAALPFLLDSMMQMLRAGNSLQQALVKSAESSGPAIRRFLDPAIHRIIHGVGPADALLWAGDRIALAELRMLAAAVQINGRHGGSMAAVLANLAGILRHAAQVRRDLHSASAEVRFSGRVLMAMPLVIAAMMTAMNPAYLRFFTATQQGTRLAVIALALQLAGMMAMRRLMRLPF